MPRLLTDWLSSYIDYASESEPPVSYHAWTGLSLIASVLQRRVWIDFGYTRIYPNMYIVLVGPSGKTKKGTAMRIGRTLLEGVFGENSNYIAGETLTREALIKLMQENICTFMTQESSETNTGNVKDKEKGIEKVNCQSPLTIFSEELSVFLGQNELKFLSMLIDWYDSSDLWKYKTKNSGSFEITGVCLNLLAATAPDWIAAMLPKEARNGGFASRVIFVVEFEKARTIPWPEITDEQRKLKKKLIHDLEEIQMISGAYVFDKKARDLYEDWYLKQEKTLQEGHSPLKSDNGQLTSYIERRATHIKKVAMNLTASRSNERIIKEEDFIRATKLLESVELNMHRAYDAVNDSRYGEAIQVILDKLVVKKKIKRSELIKELYKRFDLETLQVAEVTLEKMGLTKTVLNVIQNDAFITLLDPTERRG